MNDNSLQLVEERFTSASAGREVDYRVLLPSDRVRGERLPLVLHLHGAMSSSASLENARPLYEDLYRRGEFPRAVVACVSTPTLDGFYLDRPDGAAWETLVAEEFPARLAAAFGPFDGTALFGASMGGYGALKAAFRDPGRYAAVAALSPAVFPGETPGDVPEANRPSVLDELHRAMAHGSGDAAVYAGNCVQGLARRHAAAIRDAALPVLVDCGGADEFLLHEGAAHLHAVLGELGVAHTFRLVDGAGHVGPEAEDRTREAIRFLGGALRSRA
ncbi:MULTISPECIES: alpha/beta hydrolase [Streptomyces]|uniref:alpha/beta hydrolase n=1 Tax=Streptomyces TaxID=1883 RepID=UPI00278C0D32|nr:alpha/beta hydrolase-fold protein [Streptomyces hydrogenans]